MSLVHSTIIPWRLHAYLTKISGIINIHIPYHLKNGTRITHLILHGKLQCPGMDVQGPILSSQMVTPL